MTNVIAVEQEGVIATLMQSDIQSVGNGRFTRAASLVVSDVASATKTAWQIVNMP